MDLSSIKYFSADYEKRYGRRQTERIKIYQTEMRDDSCDRLMICLPKSISFGSLCALIKYAYENSAGHLNFVCEDESCASILKSLIIDRELENYAKCDDVYEPKEMFVNVDPVYYDNFMASTPSNKVFWHRYDYSSPYRYHRSRPTDFGYQIKLAMKIILDSGSESITSSMVKRMILGDYFGCESTEYAFYQKELKEIDEYVTSGDGKNFSLNCKTERFIYKHH